MPDPIVARRQKIQELSHIGKNIGYVCFALSMIGFFAALAFGFPSWFVGGEIFLFVLGSLVLLPSIILGYAVKAADRDDREHGRIS